MDLGGTPAERGDASLMSEALLWMPPRRHIGLVLFELVDHGLAQAFNPFTYREFGRPNERRIVLKKNMKKMKIIAENGRMGEENEVEANVLRGGMN